MGHASRSARGQVETKSLSVIGSEDRLCEREPDKPSIHINIVEQPNTKVSEPSFYLSSSFLWCSEQSLGRAETPKASGVSIIASRLYACLHSHSRV